MKKILLSFALLICTIICYSQSKNIVGSWIYRDSVSTIQFFIKADGTIEKRIAPASEYVFDKTPKRGTYTFKKEHSLLIKWGDRSIENIEVKFIENNAEFEFVSQKANAKRACLFLRIVDEEVVPDN